MTDISSFVEADFEGSWDFRAGKRKMTGSRERGMRSERHEKDTDCQFALGCPVVSVLNWHFDF